MGGPTVKCVAEQLRRGILCAGLTIVLGTCVPAGGAQPAVEQTPVRLRVTWGGGKPAARVGRIELVDPGAPPQVVGWRLLSAEPVALATMHATKGTIEIHEPRGLDRNGIEIDVVDWRRARLRVRLARRDTVAQPVVFDGPVVDLLSAPSHQPLDTEGNRLSIGRAPGDDLRVAFAPGESAIRRTGDALSLVVHPLVASQATTAAAYELKVRVRRSGADADAHTETVPVEEAATPAVAGVRDFLPLRLVLPVPADEGAFDVGFELVERGGLRWSRAVATRTVQLVAVTETAFDPPDAPWSIVYELDPGSPKLLERLRRLPGMGLPSLSMPSVTLPKMPKPSFALPKMSLPSAALPNMPLPAVPVPKMPSVATMVPRLTGLLAVGHSSLESHDLGPMLRLPPAADGPAWEAVALPSSGPGMPHLVEVEYPLGQEMVLGIAVLEEADGGVRATASSGIDLRPPVVDDGARSGQIGTRRFVFWPRTSAPLLLITNLSARSPAMFGKVRVLAGPGAVAARQRPADGARRLYVHLGTPDFSGFGAAERVDAASGRSAADWTAFLGAARRSADWAVAQGAAGALVAVYADGAAVWPTVRSHYAPRWDSGGSFEGGLDPAPKDVLDLVCRVYAREGLGLVPAIVCDGPMPQLDAVIAAGDGAAAGLVAVGRDGRPLVTDGDRCPHYNILDQRVQAAVEGIVAELVDRLRTATAIDGVAIVLPHDGWLHCPGVAAGLDDVTFARFVAEAGAEVEPLARPALGTGDAGRFAARAALVEGPLRDRWLTWREGMVAAFHGRLADIVASGGAAWNLHVMPSTLFVAGRFADRFRPHLAPEPRDVDVLRELGLDPGRITSHGRIVYVSPHVHGTGDDVGERGTVQQANRSLPLLRAAAGAARVGALLIEQPLDVDVRDVVGHASFTTKPTGLVPIVAPAGGVDARRSLAEALIATDPEVVFDAGLLHACVDEDDERCRQALGILPPPPLGMVPAVPAPLVVRAREGEAGLWLSIANASGTPCQAIVATAVRPAGVVDAVTKVSLPLGPAGDVAIPLGPWEVRTVLLEGADRITTVQAVHAADVGRAVTDLLADLRERRVALEMPAPLAVLDNPAFDLPALDGLVPGWELVEAGRGTLRQVPGKPSAGGTGLAFASDNGLATLRSNPFAAPDTGRISIAMWVRAAGTDVQPPLRIAIEGVQNDREFYRFAPVGRGPGAMPLSPAWSQFVLQVDDLPTRGLDSLRVRLDLLGPGAVEIDEVRVFDLAFDESQRVRLSKILSTAEERSATGDVGACLVELDGPWPRFLLSRVTAVPADVAAGTGSETHGDGQSPAQPARSGVIDRMRRWWQ
ncbi:MAG: hypothetical protein WCR51_07330 [Planctomycetia bacterium]